MPGTGSYILTHELPWSPSAGSTVLHATAGGPSERESISLADVREGVLTVVKLRSSERKAIVFKRGGEIHVFGELCPHMGADMSEATYCAADGTLRCRWHGYMFSADDGRFLRNPNEDFMVPLRKASQHFHPGKTPRYRLPIIQTTQKDGRLFFGAERPAEESADAPAVSLGETPQPPAGGSP